MLKVLFISRKWPPAVGGMETYSYELASELDDLVDLTKRVLPGQGNGRPPSSIQLLLFLLKTAVYLIKNRNQFDVVHFSDLVLFPLAWLDARFSRKHKRVITVHGLDIIYGNRPGAAPKVYSWFMRFIQWRNKDVNCYVSNSRNTARLAEEKKLYPVKPVPLGVRLIDYSEGEAPAELPEQYLFFFGRVVKRKGLAWFMREVLPLLPSNIKVLAAGKVWDESELTGFPVDRFRHLGLVSDEELTFHCRHSIAVVVPNIIGDGTDVEGFGLVTVDASARGGIVLASAIEGIVDAVKDDVTGYLLPAEDAPRWAEKIKDVLSWDGEAREAFLSQSKEGLQQYYSWQRVASETVEQYGTNIE